MVMFSLTISLLTYTAEGDKKALFAVQAKQPIASLAELEKLRYFIIWKLSGLNLEDIYHWPFLSVQSNEQLRTTCLESLKILNIQLHYANKWLSDARCIYAVLRADQQSRRNDRIMARIWVQAGKHARYQFGKAIEIVQSAYEKLMLYKIEPINKPACRYVAWKKTRRNTM